MKQKLKRYKVEIVFKHLKHWRTIRYIEAKTNKKAEDIVRRMFKDQLLFVKAKEINNN